MLGTILLSVALLLAPSLLLAREPPFPDIPAGAWYEGAVASFLSQGYLDPSQPQFRGGDRATRAEFVKLIVALNGGILDETPAESSFTDVATRDWFFPYIEEAAREKWVRGDRECLGKEPCTMRPRDLISRAEAAILIRRAFGKKSLGLAPAFSDNPPGEWFSEAIQIAADHCILRGDDPPSLPPELRGAGGSRRVRPHDPVNRAEMVAMLLRIDEGKRYPDCSDGRQVAQ